jgi:toxin ParE1/3/4
VKVVWSATALAHLEMIHAYLESQSAIYATQTINRLVLAADALGDFPEMGRVVPELNDDRREVIEKPYRIIYRPSSSHVEVLAVVHSARGNLERAMR